MTFNYILNNIGSMSTLETNFSKYAEDKDTTKDFSVSSGNKMILPVILAVVILIALYLIIKTLFFSQNNLAANYANQKNSSGYQAVVLNDSNLNIYFGKVIGESSTSLYLTNVFFLSASNSNSKIKSASPQYSLSHLTPSYSYGALDEMKINRSDVLFTENLSTQSQVYKAILNYYKTHSSIPNTTVPTSLPNGVHIQSKK